VLRWSGKYYMGFVENLIITNLVITNYAMSCFYRPRCRLTCWTRLKATFCGNFVVFGYQIIQLYEYITFGWKTENAFSLKNEQWKTYAFMPSWYLILASSAVLYSNKKLSECRQSLCHQGHQFQYQSKAHVPIPN